MTYNIAQFLLNFSHSNVVLPLIIIGYIWIDRKIFYHAICLGLLSMLLSHALKITFALPLPPGVNSNAFGFPSGHMQFAVSLYGYLFTQFSRPYIRIGIIGLLTGIGVSLVYCGYHYVFHIFGAIFFAAMLILFYCFTLNRFNDKHGWIMFTFASLLMGYIGVKSTLEAHLFISYYGLIGLMVGQTYAMKNNEQGMLNKIFATIICVTLLFIINLLFDTKTMISQHMYLIQLQWLLVGMSIPSSVYIASLLNKKV